MLALTVDVEGMAATGRATSEEVGGAAVAVVTVVVVVVVVVRWALAMTRSGPQSGVDGGRAAAVSALGGLETD